jgi:hypothetical protein
MTHTLVLIGYIGGLGWTEHIRAVNADTAEQAVKFAKENPGAFGFAKVSRAWVYRGLVSVTGESASDPRAA